MTEPGKNAPGLRGFPTPNSVPEDAGYTVFRFPNDNEWVGLLLGAVDALTKGYNFYQWGEMTPDEAAEAWKLIVEQAPFNTCGCTLPSGSKVIRLNPSTGHVEELGEDGEWGEPTGDYALPAIPVREGSDPVCLAAENCANVLQMLYENLSDSWNSELDEAEALTAFILALIALVGAEFAPITFALVTFFAWFFSVLYSTLEFVGADLWDENFTKQMVCILLDCATNDAGVITFDYACFNQKLAAQTNAFELTFEQLRLFGQIQFMLSVIGGADALNQAGATTAITTADCSACNDTWCYTWDFTINDGGWSLYPAAPYGTYDSGVGWQSAGGLGGRVLFVEITMPAAGTITRCEAAFTVGADNPNNNFSLTVGETNYLGGDHAGEGINDVAFDGDPVTSDYLRWGQGNGEGSGDGNGGTFTLTRITVSGTGANPYGEDNC